MNKKLLLFLVILVSVCAITHVSAADNSTLIAQDNFTEIETQTIDEPIGVEDDINSNGDSFRTIQELIDDAQEGDEISLGGGNYTCDYLIRVDKPITIDGNGAVVTYGGTKDVLSPFFYIEENASNVVLKNIKFVGGLFLYGGAITWHGDNGNIVNCEFVDNAVISDYAIGGAILVLGENCNISNCVFTNNEAFRHGGAILANGTGLIISNCEFNDNKAMGEDDHGGALVLYDSDNSLIVNCTFNNNYCSDHGGAISALLYSSNVTIKGCTFNGNYVIADHVDDEIDIPGGGAIFSVAENVTIDNCTFMENHALDGFGGAIAAYLNDTVISSSYFEANFAFEGNDICAPSHIDNIKLNYFLLDNNETVDEAIVMGVTGHLKQYLEQVLNNTVDKIKINSTVVFSPGLVFEYGDSGSISVSVDGGTIDEENITIEGLSGDYVDYDAQEGVITISGLDVGDYVLRVTTTPDENHTAVDGYLNFTVKKATAVLKASSMTVALKSSTSFSITLVDSRNNKPISNMRIALKVYTGNTYRIVYVTTNSKGVATYNTKDLAAGTHKIVVSATHEGYNFNTLTSSVKVVKQTAIKFKLIKRSSGKKASLLSYMVLNKKTGKGINGIKIKVLIYTGKTYKTYTLKSKKIKSGKKVYNGALGFSTNDFSAGKHKVTLMPVDIKYKGSVNSYIVIKKSATKYPKLFRTL